MSTEEKCSRLPPGFGIRPVRDTEAPLLCEFVRELADFEELTSECLLSVDTAYELMIGPSRIADALIAEIDGRPAGFAVYYRTLSTFAARPGIYLEDLYVRPIFRNQGIGRALLLEVGSIAQLSGSGRLEWSALRWNSKARELYRTCGAQEMEDWVLFRMNSEALATFACDGPAHPNKGCRCGAKGHRHAKDASACS